MRTNKAHGLEESVVTKTFLLILLGLLWSVRLSAIKAAGLAGIPVHVVVAVSALGIAIFFTIVAVGRQDWPPTNRGSLWFYLLSGVMGFLAPFALESFVAPQLPVFVFVVIISTMPLFTLVLSFLIAKEKLKLVAVISVAIGFVGAVTILWDTSRAVSLGDAGGWWVAAAFGVPVLYALNTVFISTRWPTRTSAIHVAHAQALIVALAAFIGSLATGVIADWSLITLDVPAVGLIILGEGLALLVYLRIARDYGANYVSMIFAAILGKIWFGVQLTLITIIAALVIVLAVAIFQRQERQTSHTD